MHSRLLPVALLLASGALAHPGGHGHIMTREELSAKQVLAEKRHLKARDCASQIAAFTQRRKAKRAGISSDFSVHRNRKLGARADDDPTGTFTSSAPSPSASVIPDNYTCVAAPDVTEGPYYINNEYVRYNLTEGQPGVELILDIGAIDLNTCEPLENVFVEIWGANATGVYSGYSATLGGAPGGSAPDSDSSSDNSTISQSFSLSSSFGPLPSSSVSRSANASASAAPSGVPDGGMGGPPGGGGSSALVRNETFCRGGLPTNSEGLVELATIYPGYYSGRTAHIHAMFHTGWEMSSNGTLMSHAGSVIHIGQIFFEESWNDQVFNTSIYSANTNERTLNDEDSILEEEAADGNNVYAEIEKLSDDIEDGLYGYITIVVDSSASLSITNTNYFNASDSSTGSTTSSDSEGGAVPIKGSSALGWMVGAAAAGLGAVGL